MKNKKKPQKLTAKQKRFCDEYLVDLNASRAAIASGYSPKTARQTACENLEKPIIKEYLKKRMAEKESSLIADQDEVLKYLTSVMRGNETDEVITASGRRGTKKVDAKDRIKAAELLGKRYGIYTDKFQADIIVPVFSGEDELED